MTKDELVKLEIEKRSYGQVLGQFKEWAGNRSDTKGWNYTVYEAIPGYEGYGEMNDMSKFLATICKKIRKLQQTIDENYDTATD